MSHWLEKFVHWSAGLGLNYNFLLDAYQRGTLEQGALTTVLLCLLTIVCLLYTSPSPRDGLLSRMPSSA